jgi:hypothetical protein
MWFFKGHGRITIHRANLPELSHLTGQMVLNTPDWSDLWVATPRMVRRVIVYIFDNFSQPADDC